MENKEPKGLQTQPLKTHKMFYAAQICLRLLATAATVSASWIMLTTKQTAVVYGITVDARYSYSSAFKFFAYANLIACGLSVITLFLVLILGRKALNPKNYFYMAVHDLILTTLLMSGCAAATAVGYVGRYGNSHTGWMPICDHFAHFCNRVTVSVMFSYLCVIFYLCLTIISADKSRQIQL